MPGEYTNRRYLRHHPLGAERESLVETITRLQKLVEDEKGAVTR
jgi:hypothetical protein